MKSTSMQELLIGPLALICVVVVFVSAILDVSQDDIRARPVVTGTLR